VPVPGDPTGTVNDITACLNSADPDSKACTGLSDKQAKKLCDQFPKNPMCEALVPGSGSGGEDGGGDNPLPLPLPGLGRAVPGEVFYGAPTVAQREGISSAEDLGYDPTLGALLIQGMVQR
jgi:hypothetical protein